MTLINDTPATRKAIATSPLPASEEALNERLLTRAYAMVAEAERLIADQRQRIRVLENLSFCDELTGLMNRRGFEMTFSRELAAAQRDTAAGGTVIFIDLDGFKRINDCFGHAAGDAYLTAIANVLSENIRDGDVAARIGGDEFAVILSRTKAMTGARRAQQLARILNAASMTWNGHTLPLAASFGAAPYGGQSVKEAVLKLADDRLYAQKAARKNKQTA